MRACPLAWQRRLERPVAPTVRAVDVKVVSESSGVLLV
jgi:hypothetical protein